MKKKIFFFGPKKKNFFFLGPTVGPQSPTVGLQSPSVGLQSPTDGPLSPSVGLRGSDCRTQGVSPLFTHSKHDRPHRVGIPGKHNIFFFVQVLSLQKICTHAGNVKERSARKSTRILFPKLIFSNLTKICPRARTRSMKKKTKTKLCFPSVL